MSVENTADNTANTLADNRIDNLADNLADNTSDKTTDQAPESARVASTTDWLAALLVDTTQPAAPGDAADFTAAVMHRVRLQGPRGVPLAADQALRQLLQRRAREWHQTRWGCGGAAAGVALALGTLVFVRGADLAGAAALPGWAALPLVALLVTAVLVYSVVGDSRA